MFSTVSHAWKHNDHHTTYTCKRMGSKFFLKQNHPSIYRVVFDIRQCAAQKIPVHKIQFFFMIWVTVVLHRCKCSSVAFCGNDTDPPVYCISCIKIMLGDIPYIALIFLDFPQIACVIYVILPCLKWNLLLKTFHVLVNCLPVCNN